MGSNASKFVEKKLQDPGFRLAFAKARSKRIKRALAEAVKAARIQLNISQIKLAKKVGTTQSVISRIENPNIAYLASVNVLSRIAVALGAQLEIAFVKNKSKAA